MEILWSRIISSFVSYENANLRSNNLLTFYLRPSSSKHKLIKKKKNSSQNWLIRVCNVCRILLSSSRLISYSNYTSRFMTLRYCAGSGKSVSNECNRRPWLWKSFSLRFIQTSFYNNWSFDTSWGYGELWRRCMLWVCVLHFQCTYKYTILSRFNGWIASRSE